MLWWMYFGLGLPVAIWLWAAVAGLMDASARSKPIVRLALAISGLLIATLLDTRILHPLSYACAVVVALHLLRGLRVTHWMTGVPILDAPLDAPSDAHHDTPGSGPSGQEATAQPTQAPARPPSDSSARKVDTAT